MPTLTATTATTALLAATLIAALAFTAGWYAAPHHTELPNPTQNDPAEQGSVEAQPVAVDGDILPPIPDDGSPDPADGSAAPTLTGSSFTGADTTSVAPTDGQPTILIFLAHWCPFCQQEVPRLTPWIDSNLDQAHILAVSTAEDPAAGNWPASQWLADEQWAADTLVDDRGNSAARSYGITAFPSTVILNSDHTVHQRVTGSISPAQLDQALTDTR